MYKISILPLLLIILKLCHYYRIKLLLNENNCRNNKSDYENIVTLYVILSLCRL